LLSRPAGQRQSIQRSGQTLGHSKEPISIARRKLGGVFDIEQTQNMSPACTRKDSLKPRPDAARHSATDNAVRVKCEAVEWPFFAPHALSLLSHLPLILSQGRERRPTLWVLSTLFPDCGSGDCPPRPPGPLHLETRDDHCGFDNAEKYERLNGTTVSPKRGPSAQRVEHLRNKQKIAVFRDYH
jgi:hypothetical protein